MEYGKEIITNTNNYSIYSTNLAHHMRGGLIFFWEASVQLPITLITLTFTVDALYYVRMLKSLNPPVYVHFERENIDTAD